MMPKKLSSNVSASALPEASKARVRRADQPSPTAERKNQAQILEAAAALFMNSGYHATSIDDVAAYLGSTKGLIYYSFKSKADLFFEVHREAMRRNFERIRPLSERRIESQADLLRKMLHEHALLIMENFSFQRVSIQGVEMHLTSSTTPKQRDTLHELMTMRDEYEAIFFNVLKKGMKKGEFRFVDGRVATKMLLGALNWMTIWYHPRINEAPSARAALADEVVDFLMPTVMASEKT